MIYNMSIPYPFLHILVFLVHPFLYLKYKLISFVYPLSKPVEPWALPESLELYVFSFFLIIKNYRLRPLDYLSYCSIDS